MADTQAPAQIDVTEAVEAFREYAKHGANAEYTSLEMKLGLGMRQGLTTYWNFIRDAVNGMGGFSNGLYLYPTKLEIENSRVTAKLISRRDQADYDNFSRDILDAAWDQIVQSRDLVIRRADKDLDVEAFWSNVDGRDLNIVDFLEFPFRQARMYGTGYVFVDRGQNIGAYAAQSLSLENRPWCYSVPSENVVDWHFDEQGEVEDITIVEPTTDEVWQYVNLKWSSPAYPHNLLTWTKDSWCRHEAVPRFDDKGNVDNLGFALIDGGANEAGVVPMVPLFNDTPAPKRMIGNTEMFDVSKLSQTVFNIDSEAREIERKCALFLAMPVKNARDYESKAIETGLDNIMVYDGDAGEPRWISPDLEILKKLEERRARIISSAYKMGHLRALLADIKTQSGFHAEIEFAKTERRVSRHASQLEQFEIKLAHMYQRFIGKKPGGVEISYPREYGVRDLERQLARTEIIIALQLGDKVNKETLFDMLKTFYPRKSTKELDVLVQSAVASLAQARLEQQQAMLGGAGGGAVTVPGGTGKSAGANAMPGKGSPSQSARIQKVLERVQTNLLGSAMKASTNPSGA